MLFRSDPLWSIDGVGLSDEFALDAGQATEVLLLGQHLGLKSLQAEGQCRTTIPSFLGTDQPERRILRGSLGIVDILIARDAAVGGVAQELRRRKLRVLPASSEVTRDPWKSTLIEALKES